MAGFAALLVLAGCSEPEAANDTLPTATSTSASPTLEPLGPADFPVPDEAREQTEAGAEAMAVYYFGLITYSQAVPTGSPLRDLADGCADCGSIADSQDRDAASGARVVGGAFNVASAAAELTSETQANVAVRIDRAASTVMGPDGGELAGRSGPAATLSGGVLLTWDESRDVWLVNQIDLQAV